MNMIVCVKHVPRTENVHLKAGEEFSPVGLAGRLNLFDTFAIEAAARIKEKISDAKILLLSIGSEGAERALIEGLSIAADKAFLVRDDAYTGCDAVASARILAEAIKRIEAEEGFADLILTGKQSTDSGSGVMSEMLSELLGRKAVASVSEISSVSAGNMEFVVRNADGFASAHASLPFILSLTKPPYEVRLATFKRIREANKAYIPNFDSQVLGSFDAATKVLKVIKPGRNNKNSIIHEEDAIASTELLLSMLKEDKIFER